MRCVEAEVGCRTSLDGDRYFDRDRAAELLRGHFAAATLRGFGLADDEPGVTAAAAALAYAKAAQFSDLRHVATLTLREGAEAMVIDATTLANLEIFRNQREGGKKATLLAVLDRTLTPAGGRLLRDWLRRPLRDPAQIAARHDAVAELLARPAVREEVRGALEMVGDPERLLSRAVLGTITPREAGVLRDGLRRLPGILAALAPCGAAELQAIAAVDRAGRPLLRARTHPGRGAAGHLQKWRGDRRRARRGARPLAFAGPRFEGPHPGARDPRAEGDRHSFAQDPLQPGLRVLPRDHQRQPAPGAGALSAQADPGRRRALRDAGDQGSRRADPERRGEAAGARAELLRGAGAADRRRRLRGCRRWRRRWPGSTSTPRSPSRRPSAATAGRSCCRRGGSRDQGRPPSGGRGDRRASLSCRTTPSSARTRASWS